MIPPWGSGVLLAGDAAPLALREHQPHEPSVILYLTREEYGRLSQRKRKNNSFYYESKIINYGSIHLLYPSAQLPWWHTLTGAMMVESCQLVAHSWTVYWATDVVNAGRAVNLQQEQALSLILPPHVAKPRSSRPPCDRHEQRRA